MQYAKTFSHHFTSSVSVKACLYDACISYYIVPFVDKVKSVMYFGPSCCNVQMSNCSKPLVRSQYLPRKSSLSGSSSNSSISRCCPECSYTAAWRWTHHIIHHSTHIPKHHDYYRPCKHCAVQTLCRTKISSTL